MMRELAVKQMKDIGRCELNSTGELPFVFDNIIFDPKKQLRKKWIESLVACLDTHTDWDPEALVQTDLKQSIQNWQWFLQLHQERPPLDAESALAHEKSALLATNGEPNTLPTSTKDPASRKD